MITQNKLAKRISKLDANHGWKATVTWEALWEKCHLGYLRAASYAMCHVATHEKDPITFARGLCAAICVNSDTSTPVKKAIAQTVYNHQPHYWQELAADVVKELHNNGFRG